MYGLTIYFYDEIIEMVKVFNSRFLRDRAISGTSKIKEIPQSLGSSWDEKICKQKLYLKNLVDCLHIFSSLEVYLNCEESFIFEVPHLDRSLRDLLLIDFIYLDK